MHPFATPLQALSEELADRVEIAYARGAEADLSATLLGSSILEAPDGFEVEIFAGHEAAGEVLNRRHLDDLRYFVVSFMSADMPKGDWSLRARGTVIPQESGAFQLALAQSGRARVLFDGVPVLDGFSNVPPAGGRDFFGMASQDLLSEVTLTAGVPVDVIVEYANIESGLDGFRVGFRTVDADGLIARAADAAREADVALVFVGTTAEWETEGMDRTSFELPGRQPDLIRAVAAVNPRTVVVVNAGTVVDMSWADDAAALIQCWFSGQELARGVTDVLVGRSDPAGRMPTTVPMRLEHCPSHGNFPGENGAVRYAEGLFMGYRGYEYRAITPRFAFGHGSSYTTFEMGAPTLSATSLRAAGEVTVRVPVTNTGRAQRLTGRAVVRRAAGVTAHPSLEGAQGVLQGQPGPGREHASPKFSSTSVLSATGIPVGRTPSGSPDTTSSPSRPLPRRMPSTPPGSRGGSSSPGRTKCCSAGPRPISRRRSRSRFRRTDVDAGRTRREHHVAAGRSGGLDRTVVGHRVGPVGSGSRR